ASDAAARTSCASASGAARRIARTAETRAGASGSGAGVSPEAGARRTRYAAAPVACATSRGAHAADEPGQEAGGRRTLVSRVDGLLTDVRIVDVAAYGKLEKQKDARQRGPHLHANGGSGHNRSAGRLTSSPGTRP